MKNAYFSKISNCNNVKKLLYLTISDLKMMNNSFCDFPKFSPSIFAYKL